MNNLGLIESNGHQNYKNWKEMMSYHPHNNGSWVKAKNGVYSLGSDFYKKSGGIFDRSSHVSWEVTNVDTTPSLSDIVCVFNLDKF